jgi:hypothetical protein
VVLQDRESVQQLAAWLEFGEVPEESPPGGRNEARRNEYAMLGEIDFSHPVFAVFSDPQYNDFTKIHFWKHFRLDLPEAPTRRVLARFDDGSPALWHERKGKGHLFALASGWTPADSELARSSKFVPLLGGILDQARGQRDMPTEVTVHEVLNLPPREGPLTVLAPDGTRTELPAGETGFRGTDQPGIYRLEWSDARQTVAVNLAASESDTPALDPQQLEQLGVRLGTQSTRSEELARERQLRDLELEGRQKIWQWLVAGVLGFLCLESWLAGRRSRQ